ncbi:MAG: porin [Paracoccaceae bacterium]
MKKLLLASTALVGFAGAAAAEVALSGYAEIGIKGGTGMETQFHNDIDVTFSMSGETDNGLQFGATIDLDEVNASAEVGGTGTTNLSSVWVSGEFGKVTLGDTDGAFDWAMKETSKLTSIADDHSTHAGFSGNGGLDGTYDGQVMRYEYAMDAISFAVSAELDDTGAGDPVFGIGFKWSGDMGGTTVGVGIGHQTVSGGADITGISLDASMAGGFYGILNYSDHSVTGSHTGVALGYNTGALTAEVNYGEFEAGGEGYGLAVNYDMGGGAVAMLGYGKTNGGGSTWSAGLGLSF